jgi:hypothetical protein
MILLCLTIVSADFSGDREKADSGMNGFSGGSCWRTELEPVMTGDFHRARWQSNGDLHSPKISAKNDFIACHERRSAFSS